MPDERPPPLEDVNTCHMKKRSTRGRTTLKVVAPMNGKKHRCYIFDDGRIVGPRRRKLPSFLGILARNHCLFPIHKEWGLEHESTINRVMVEVHRDYDFFSMDETPFLSFEDVINFVKKTINQQLRDFRALLKSKLDPHIPIVEQVQPLDNKVPPDHWLSLIEFWSKETKMVEASRNKRSRSVLHATHTSGQISFCERQDKAEKDGVLVPIVETYLNSHKKKNGEYISEKMKEICEKIELMSRELGAQKAKQPFEFISIVDDAHGSHHRGYKRGFSGGITRRNLKKKILAEESNRIAIIAWKSQLEDKDNQIKEKYHQIKEKERELEILRAKIKSLECQGMSANNEFNSQATPHALDGTNYDSLINVQIDFDLDEPYDPLTSYQIQRSPTHYRASGMSKRVLGPNIGTQ